MNEIINSIQSYLPIPRRCEITNFRTNIHNMYAYIEANLQSISAATAYIHTHTLPILLIKYAEIERHWANWEKIVEVKGYDKFAMQVKYIYKCMHSLSVYVSSCVMYECHFPILIKCNYSDDSKPRALEESDRRFIQFKKFSSAIYLVHIAR